MKELSVEELTAEAMKLLTIGMEELHVVLGCQLLGCRPPARVAGMMSYLSALKKALETRDMYETLSCGTNVAAWGKGFEVMYDELRQDGVSFLDTVRKDLRKGLCNDDILRLTDDINHSSMQIIVLVIGAILKMPPEIESVSATVAAILCKTGLEKFCEGV